MERLPFLIALHRVFVQQRPDFCCVRHTALMLIKTRCLRAWYSSVTTTCDWKDSRCRRKLKVFGGGGSSCRGVVRGNSSATPLFRVVTVTRPEVLVLFVFHAQFQSSLFRHATTGVRVRSRRWEECLRVDLKIGFAFSNVVRTLCQEYVEQHDIYANDGPKVGNLVRSSIWSCSQTRYVQRNCVGESYCTYTTARTDISLMAVLPSDRPFDRNATTLAAGLQHMNQQRPDVIGEAMFCLS